ncbi:16S rRNA (cytosine(1402)-N(4))-methyltransferase [Hydrogenovibrio sp. SC-1]|uniref:16S rRNA (cytosine(1402)-N(4))-methyltransferase RsmH n=1 Tax=Hydrogenovibrio sp. SC-1 TaxID=2065820 RepID=UPI000C7BFDEB|nr:16S rRNA (cytosine(1402)-N(4))-methyltransferase RsmH [Hydrogenovibrio sp. SC-1]PLA75138.1 16S rRNA (cytosine(1402)-N(4))-methyltransferase [Hydrogenovibrio sp. SC-1]
MTHSKEIEQTSHYPVMLQEAVSGLSISDKGVYIDCTFGRGGHSQLILSQLSKNGRLLAIDQDPEAVAFAKEYFLADQFEIQQGSFEALESYCQSRNWLGQVDGILIDLGVSSPQLDEAERGFSFMRSGPLDMRMNPQSGLSAKEWLVQTDEKTLAKVLRQYGEEKFSGRIARHIKEALAEGILNTTLDLAAVVKKASPKTEKHKHPATRTFQAIRIAVNRELDVLKTVLEASVRVLKPGGRLSVISFHSLEDRIVKQFIRDQSRIKDLFPDSPIELEVVKPVLKKVGKPIFPSAKECEENPRSRSAVLRVAERLG